MMRNRIVTLLLVLAMLLSLLPVQVYAAPVAPAAQEAQIGPTKYKTLTEALKYAKSGDTVKLLKNVTLKESCEILEGVTLLIPFSSADNGAAGPDGAGNAVTPDENAYCTLTVDAGVELSVAGGLLVNAEIGAKDEKADQGVNGAFGKIQLEGKICVKKGGELSCLGYIVGDGQVTAQSGAKVSDLFTAHHWRGEETAQPASQKGIWPMNEYACHNIQSKLRIESGAKLTGYMKMFKDEFVTTEIPLIGSDALLRLSKNGYAERSYLGEREVFDISGGAVFSNSKFWGKTDTIDTGSYIFPFDGDMTLNLNNGSYRFEKAFKFMPGAIVNAGKNVSLTIDENAAAVFYNKDEFQDRASDQTTLYPTDRASAELILAEGASLHIAGTFAGQLTADAEVGAITKTDLGEDAAATRELYEANLDHSGYQTVNTASVYTRDTYNGARWEDNTLHWIRPVYTIFFMSDGSVVSEVTEEWGADIQKPDDPTKTGYTLDGWYDNAALDGEAYVFDKMPQESITLYAKWVANTYTVFFDANGGEGTMAAQTHTFDADLALTANAFTRAGYSFAGWKTADDTPYTDGQSVRNLTAENGGEITLYAQWTANTYTVTLDVNGGTLEEGAATTLEVTFDGVYSLPTPRRLGYTFNGWYLGEEEIKNNSNIAITEDSTFVAKWDIGDSYNITYHLDGGALEVGKDNPQQYNAATESFTLNNPSKEGYTFLGWTGSNGEVPSPSVTVEKGSAGDRYYTANWQVNRYTVTFQTEGGTEIPAITQDYGTTIEAPADPTKTGYTFAGWDIEIPATMPARDLTVTALWTINSYTITFVTNGGDTILQQTREYGEAIGTLPTVTNPPAGYRFDGWQNVPTQMPANDVTLTASYTSYLDLLMAVNVDENLPLARQYYGLMNEEMKASYAATAHKNTLWEAIEAYETRKLIDSVAAARVATNATLVEDGQAIATLTVLEKQEVEVCLEQPSYKARGMLDKPFLKELFTYEGVQSIHFPALVGDPANLTPYAHKDQMQLMLRIAYATLNTEGKDFTSFQSWLMGEKDTLEISELDGKSIEVMLQGTAAEGVSYQVTFLIGFFNKEHQVTWNPANGTAPTTQMVAYGESITKPEQPTKTGYTFSAWEGYTDTMGKTDLTFTARWTANTYTVSFDSKGGSACAPITVTYDSTYTLPAPTRSGYTFLGWYLNGTKVENNSKVTITDNVTLEAQWESGEAYSVSYDLAGGVLPEGQSNPAQFNMETATFTLVNPVKTGYTFLGWTGSNGSVPSTSVTIEKGSTGNCSYTANWQINRYTITFATNGGTEIPAITQDYGTEITAPDAPTKTGYTFAGWDKVIPATMPAENVTVTASWTINVYTITFVTDGGTEIAPIILNYGSDITAPAKPTKTGYTFAGWDKEIPATMPAENMTITAKWTVNQYTVTFATNGGTEIPAITQDYGTEITAPDAPTKTGYTFAGWDKEIPATMPAENVTVTALWTANTYTVFFDANGGNAVEPITVTYDAPYGTLPTPEYSGFDFLGWFTAITGGTKVAETDAVAIMEDITLYAHWNEKGDTPYTVEHYLQNVEGEDYTLTDSLHLTGKTNAAVETTQNSYVGFALNEDKSELTGTIAGDGSTVLKLYYDRKVYTVTWVLADRTVTQDYRYDAMPVCADTSCAADDRAAYIFTGWDKEVVAVTGNCTYTASYQADFEARTVGGETWRTMALALERAESGDVIRIERDVTLSESVTVPAGVTLLIPCMNEDGGYIRRGKYLMSPDGTSAAGNEGVGPNAALYRTLTVAENVTLTVEGSVLVNAVTGRPAAGPYDMDVTGGYGVLNLIGTAVVAKGGHLDAFGYVQGTGSVTVQNGGTAGDLYVVRNWRGGTQALKMYETNIYPMNEYDCHNISTVLRVEFGGTLEGLVKMYAAGEYNYTRFPQVNNDNGLIRLRDGKSYLLRTYADGIEHYEIHGGADVGSSTLTIVGMPLSTAEFLYPIDGDIHFDLIDGAYSFINDYKLMPGAMMNLKNATLTVEKDIKVVFYQEFKDVPNTGDTQYPADRGAAVLYVDGKSGFTNAGTFAGKIITETPNIFIGETPCWEITTYEANGYAGSRPKEEHTVALPHTLDLTREGHTWTFGDRKQIIWDDTPADYSAVEAAIALIPTDLSVYTPESVAALQAALDAVISGLTIDRQAEVDAWAEAILAATANLVLTVEPADYSAVEAAKALIPADLSIYTDESVAVLKAALAAVIVNLPATQQAQVDAWAKAIVDAVAGLVKKDTTDDPGPGPDPEDPLKAFIDLPDETDWAYKGIRYVVEHGLFNGTSETTFEPNSPMTRAMVVTVLWRMAGEPETGENTFVDIAEGQWYTKAIAWATATKLTLGVDSTHFDPEQWVTRDQFATFLYRYASIYGLDTGKRADLSGYPDADEVLEFAQAAIQWCVAEGLLEGSDGYLMPCGNLLRCQAAAMLMRFQINITNK